MTQEHSESSMVNRLVFIGTLIFLLCSITRHLLFCSTLYDLSWFSQSTYLISRGMPPLLSFIESSPNLHILGDHASFILYPLSLLHLIFPSVYWLFLVQALALASAALPIWSLSLEAGLSRSLSIAVVIFYLLNPIVFNVNLFDFHPEVIALPTFFWAVLKARQSKFGWFIATVLLILSCKAVLSLTVISMGLWLWFFEQKKVYGMTAIGLGGAWFMIATQFIIPHFSGEQPAAVGRYAYLGDSIPQIILNLILKPGIVLSHLFTGDNLGYLLLLIIPFAWGLSWKHCTPILVALPMISLNLLSTVYPQKDLIHQYNIPILPFFIVAIIATLAAGKGILRTRKAIVVWSMLMFLSLAKFGYFGTKYLVSIDTWQATHQALAYIKTDEPLLTIDKIAPHVDHRPILKVASLGSENIDLSQFKYILLNQRYPGQRSSSETIATLKQRLEIDPAFDRIYDQSDVFLFMASTIQKPVS